MKRLFVILTALLISGCASKQLAVTYYSDPPGAVLYQNQTRFGYTPFTLYYNVSDDEREQGTKRLAGTTVKWLSGASASYSYIDADLVRFGYRQSVTYRRPDNVPGRDIDEKFAFDLSTQRAQQNYQNQQLNLQREQLEEEKKKNQRTPIQVTPSTTSICGWEGPNWVCRTQ